MLAEPEESGGQRRKEVLEEHNLGSAWLSLSVFSRKWCKISTSHVNSKEKRHIWVLNSEKRGRKANPSVQ